ncbi:MAG: CsbD family protein [Solirubrobacterales bacterium]
MPDKVDSFIDKAKGRVKEAAGDLTGDKGLQQQGQKEQNRAEAKDELREAQDTAAEKAAEVDRRS